MYVIQNPMRGVVSFSNKTPKGSGSKGLEYIYTYLYPVAVIIYILLLVLPELIKRVCIEKKIAISFYLNF